MAAAPVKTSGPGWMKAKVGPVPVPILVAVVVAVGVFIYVKRRGSTSATSAGSNATPSTLGTASQYPTEDSTGGGSGGMDLSSLFDILQGINDNSARLAELSGAPTYATGQPDFGSSVTSTQPNDFLPPSTTSGGNTAPPVTASQPSAPTTTQIAAATQAVASGVASVGAKLPAATSAGTVSAPWIEYPVLNLSNAKAGDTGSVVQTVKNPTPAYIVPGGNYGAYRPGTPPPATKKKK